MTPVRRVDDAVMEFLKKRAVELGLVFNTQNAVVRKLLLPQVDEEEMQTTRTIPEARERERRVEGKRVPHSDNPNVQRLLDSLLPDILRLSTNGLTSCPAIQRWVATPNVVAIRVQDARAGNLAVHVYGEPDDSKIWN
ncbi:MAG: hypothetical protein FJ312_03295 [SAR202 cluster bacterium]|nr:hypothetical protein [SAR202 cluster bacterium]